MQTIFQSKVKKEEGGGGKCLGRVRSAARSEDDDKEGRKEGREGAGRWRRPWRWQARPHWCWCWCWCWCCRAHPLSLNLGFPAVPALSAMLALLARRGRPLALARALLPPPTVAAAAAVPRLPPSLAAVRGPAALPDAASASHGLRALVAEARCGGRRFFMGSHSHKADVGVEAAAVPAASVSKLNFVAWYLRKLDQRPLLTKSLTAGAIYTGSDLCSQGLSALTTGDEEPPSWDAARSVRMLAVGLFMSGPLLHLWFGRVGKLIPGRDISSTLKKLVLGQLFFGPAFCAAFFSINAYAQGERGAQITTRLQRDLIPTLKNGLMYWPACDFITYRYVPIPLQPLVSNSFSFLWTIYLTFMAGKKAAKTSSTIDPDAGLAGSS